MNDIDQRDYRRALGSFATGVAVVTALNGHGEKVGITINSFSSVSLGPPLILWSVSVDSERYNVFLNAKHFAVHVLNKRQRDVCEKFAARDDGKFDGMDCKEGIAGVPILPEFSAVFECEVEHRYNGGDHTILVGRVQRFEDRHSDPLVIHRGKYLQLGDNL